MRSSQTSNSVFAIDSLKNPKNLRIILGKQYITSESIYRGMSISKNLNNLTYSNNICYEDMFNLKFEGLVIIPSKTAMREMTWLGLDLCDCILILEEGYSTRKRKKGTVEKSFNVGNKTLKVVVVKSYNYTQKKDVYLITHVGETTKKRRRK